MARRLGVLGFAMVVLALFVWAGVHNLRARRAAMQQADQAHLTITKQEGGMSFDDSGAPNAQGITLKGKDAPGFTLVDTEGKKTSLKDYKGHPVVVNFWAVYCGPCKTEMPYFEQLAKQYASQGLVVLGIDSDGDKSRTEIATAAKHLGVSYPILVGDDTVDKAYGGIDFLPQTFYIDKTGHVVEATAGGRPLEEIEADVHKVLGAGAL